MKYFMLFILVISFCLVADEKAERYYQAAKEGLDRVNPQNDSIYIILQKKSLNQMTVQEAVYYSSFKIYCLDKQSVYYIGVMNDMDKHR